MNDISTGIIGVLLILLASTGALYKCERDARVEVEQSYAVALEVNKANDAALQTIKEFQESTTAAVSAFVDSKVEIDKLRKSVNASIKRLLSTNEDFRKWFSSIVHPDAVRLYNETGRATQDNGK